MSAVPAHQVDVARLAGEASPDGGLHFQAVCICGWKAAPRPPQDATAKQRLGFNGAWDDALTHTRLQREAIT